jgi:hypothetical protein
LSLWALIVAIGQVPVEAQEAVIVGRLADGTVPEAVVADWGAGLKIRETVVRALPGRTVTIHRVDDPGRAVRTNSGPRAEADTDSPESPATAEPASPAEVLSLSARVVDRAYSLLQWSHKGRQFTSWSNVDFNYLTGFTRLRWGARDYTVLLMVQNIDTALLPPDVAYSPPPELDIPEPAFLPMEEDLDHPDAFDGILALHELYLAEEARLKQAFEGRAALLARREAERQNGAAEPRDIVIRYWKVQR